MKHTPYSTVSFRMTLSDLANYSVTRSVARSLWDSWASCFEIQSMSLIWRKNILQFASNSHSVIDYHQIAQLFLKCWCINLCSVKYFLFKFNTKNYHSFTFLLNIELQNFKKNYSFEFVSIIARCTETRVIHCKSQTVKEASAEGNCYTLEGLVITFLLHLNCCHYPVVKFMVVDWWHVKHGHPGVVGGPSRREMQLLLSRSLSSH